ncbi:hypothetical protein EJ110_NYTH56431 [Nymphaea thermarum]|nr:hypothetical protein EJ110_NYTH56431 [Nymphaea thermarum]
MAPRKAKTIEPETVEVEGEHVRVEKTRIIERGEPSGTNDKLDLILTQLAGVNRLTHLEQRRNPPRSHSSSYYRRNEPIGAVSEAFLGDARRASLGGLGVEPPRAHTHDPHRDPIIPPNTRQIIHPQLTNGTNGEPIHVGERARRAGDRPTPEEIRRAFLEARHQNEPFQHREGPRRHQDNRSNHSMTLGDYEEDLDREIEMLNGHGRGQYQAGFNQGRKGRNQEEPRLPMPKMDFPRIDGKRPKEWIYKAEQYFICQEIADQHRIRLSKMYLEKEAIEWYCFWEEHFPNATWDFFKEELLLRFGDTTYVNHEIELRNLKQTSTVQDYQTKFERLSNMVKNRPVESKIAHFIGGLNEDIQIEMLRDPPTELRCDLCLGKGDRGTVQVQGRSEEEGKVTPQTAFNVLVGNGERMSCNEVCKNVSLEMQKTPFLLDLYLLPIGGVDLVLGIQWMKPLKRTLLDWENMTLTFPKEGGGEITLEAINPNVTEATGALENLREVNSQHFPTASTEESGIIRCEVKSTTFTEEIKIAPSRVCVKNSREAKEPLHEKDLGGLDLGELDPPGLRDEGPSAPCLEDEDPNLPSSDEEGLGTLDLENNVWIPLSIREKCCLNQEEPMRLGAVVPAIHHQIKGLNRGMELRTTKGEERRKIAEGRRKPKKQSRAEKKSRISDENIRNCLCCRGYSGSDVGALVKSAVKVPCRRHSDAIFVFLKRTTESTTEPPLAAAISHDFGGVFRRALYRWIRIQKFHKISKIQARKGRRLELRRVKLGVVKEKEKDREGAAGFRLTYLAGIPIFAGAKEDTRVLAHPTLASPYSEPWSYLLQLGGERLKGRRNCIHQATLEGAILEKVDVAENTKEGSPIAAGFLLWWSLRSPQARPWEQHPPRSGERVISGILGDFVTVSKGDPTTVSKSDPTIILDLLFKPGAAMDVTESSHRAALHSVQTKPSQDYPSPGQEGGVGGVEQLGQAENEDMHELGVDTEGGAGGSATALSKAQEDQGGGSSPVPVESSLSLGPNPVTKGQPRASLGKSRSESSPSTRGLEEDRF